MGAMTIRNIPDEVHRALKQRAALNGRSAEAEVREILLAATRAENQVRLGDELVALGRKFGGIDLELPERTKEFPNPPKFE